MGLSASQARLLGLTARKSNVEFQGQQINQQRTALSNEVMNLYSEYNKLTVPVPPSISDFTKTTYTLDSSSEGYEISSFTKILDGEYKGYYDVVLTYNKEIPKAYTHCVKDSVITVEEDGDGYSYINFLLGTDTYTYNALDEKNSTITKIKGDYESYPGLKTIMDKYQLTDGIFYMYSRNGVFYYTPEKDLDGIFKEISSSDNYAYDPADNRKKYYGDYSFDYQGIQNIEDSVDGKAALTQDSSGRLQSIYFIECSDPDLVDNVYSIKTGTKEDQREYQDAMNKYNYDKQVYENEVERINKKTKSIQDEDRGLELKLNQLDTEQQALKTEMDSVKSVIKETLESVFKTFE